MTISTPSLSAVDVEIGWAANSSIDMNWVRSNTTDGLTNLGGVNGRAWYQNNSWGANCYNGNCNCNCVTMAAGNLLYPSSPNCQCNTTNCNIYGNLTNCSYFNCQLVGNVNCGNCQSRAYLQGDCNCACSYQCNTAAWAVGSNNCNCNCSCFPSGSKVLMASLEWKNIEEVALGELVMGADGNAVEVVDPYVTKLGQRKMLSMEDDSIFWSEEHAFWTKDSSGKEWWWSAEPDTWRAEVEEGVIGGLKDNLSLRSGKQVSFATLSGWKTSKIFSHPNFSPETPLFLPHTNGVPIIVNGYVVGAGVNEFNFDYTQFTWKELR